MTAADPPPSAANYERMAADYAAHPVRSTEVIGPIELAGASDGTPTQSGNAPAHILAETIENPETQNDRVSATQPVTARRRTQTHVPIAVATLFSSDHRNADAHTCCVAAEPSSAGSHPHFDAQDIYAPGGFLRDPVLGVLAEVVDDLESVRIANANRVRQLTRTATDKDGEARGFGLTAQHPEVAKLILTVKALEAAEHDAVLNLQRALRKHPLASFQKRHRGIGEKQLARLLAAIGDPYWNDLHQRPRTVSELWAYCGFHVIRTSSSDRGTGDTQSDSVAAGTQPHAGDQSSTGAQPGPVPGVAPKRQRGQRSNWSETARKRVWVIASAMPKFPGGHYETVYRDARSKYAEAKHAFDCVRCGPSGAPAVAGTPLSDGHKHARAVRLTAKEILKDLWIEAQGLRHDEPQAVAS